jgi:hypothetical protein
MHLGSARGMHFSLGKKPQNQEIISHEIRKISRFG